jgi:MGT family glycosyltransferase
MAALLRILFCTYEGGGHVAPMLLTARDAQARGHAVLVVSDACNARDAQALGLPFQSWRTAPNRHDKDPAGDPLRDWEAETPADAISQICDRLLIGPAVDYALDVQALAAEFRPDVIVSQELLFGVMLAAERLGLPFAILTANIWCFPTLPGQPPFGAGLPPSETAEDQMRDAMIATVTRQLYDHHLDRYNAVRSGFELPPLASLLDQPHRAERILLSTARAFDFAPEPLPEPFRYVGPKVVAPAWSAPWSSPWPADDPRPFVVVSFSTLFQDQGRTIRNCIAALEGLSCRGVVTLGPVLEPADFPAPETVLVVKSADHDQLVPQAAAVITHGGHGTVLRPLRHGVPLLCLPMGRDQPDNAARIEARGAGLTLAPESDPAAIRSAVRRLLEEPAFRAAAAQLGAAIEAAAGQVEAVDELEAVAAAYRV